MRLALRAEALVWIAQGREGKGKEVMQEMAGRIIYPPLVNESAWFSLYKAHHLIS